MNVRRILASKNVPAWKRSPKHIHAMKTSLRRIIPVGALGIALTISSCVSPYYGAYGPGPQNGAVAGAIGGGAVGGIIGNQSGRGLEGAAIGALLGTLAGSALSANQPYYGYNGGNYGRSYGYNRPYYGGYNRPYYGGGYGCRPAGYSSVSFGTGFGGGYGGRPFGGFGGGFNRPCW